MAFFGLKQLIRISQDRFEEIIRESEVFKELTVEDIVFKIGPRINAAGRMETGRQGVDLLVSNDIKLAAGISRESIIFNNEGEALTG